MEQIHKCGSPSVGTGMGRAAVSLLETTQLYTHVTINDLRVMHSKFHPREQPPKE